MKQTIRCILLFWSLALLGCAADQIAGGGTETGHARTQGTLVKLDGTPASGTQVYLRPNDYLPNITAKVAAQLALKILDSTATDSLGNFAFDSIDAGTYTLECVDAQTEMGSLIDSVVVDNPDSITVVETDTLRPLGVLEGRIQLPDSAALAQTRVLLYGLDRVAVPDSTGAFAIAGLPEGKYDYRIVTPDTSVDLKGNDGASIASGRITSIPASFLLYPTIVGDVYFVSPSGSDSALGTMGEPFRTISRGLNSAQAGDTVYVMNGTYGEPIVLNYSGQPNAPIVLTNYPGHSPVIRFSDTAGTAGAIQLQSVPEHVGPIGWIIIEGFEITNGWVGIILNNAHDVIIRNNNIHHMSLSGISGNGVRVLIDRNIIANTGRFVECQSTPEFCNQDHAVNLTGTHVTISNNLIHSNLAYGIQAAGYAFNSADHVAAEYAGARYWIVANNTIAFQQNRAGMIIWQQDASDIRIENNIFYMNAQKLTTNELQGVEFYSCGGNHVLRNNLFYAAGQGGALSVSDTSGVYHSGSGNLYGVNPLFENDSAFDFHLKTGSPAIDTGLNSGIAHDFEGTLRPKSAGFDIGAYEK